jgi:hypothetical protein
MYGHERSLVAKYKGRPFVLLGVNQDEDAATLKKAQEENQLAWRSWYDGYRGGPIARAWGIDGFPTVFLIDANGVIRYAPPGVNEQELDRKIEELVKEAETK